MAGGRHTWVHHVTLGGVDVSARCRGQVWHRQEASAAHLGRVRLALAGSDPDAEADAATGLALVVTVGWDGAAAVPWFSGTVQTADYDDSEGVLVLEASDRLQEWAEAQTEAAIDAAVTGSKRIAEVQEARRDGWTQLLACLKTVRASYAIGRDGVHRLTAWTGGTVALSLGASAVRSQGVARVRRALRERVNRVSWRVAVRGVRLSQWSIAASCTSTGTYCEWLADMWVRPPVATVREAVLAAGPVVQSSGWAIAGPGSAGGITFTLPPETPSGGQPMYCNGAPVDYWQDPTVCLGAGWTWDIRSRQLIEYAYTLQVDCEASQAAWGVLADERDATLDLSGEYAGWESGSDGRPEPDDWTACPGGEHWLSIPRAREVALIESALAEAAATIAGTHRQDLRVAALPWAVQAVDLHYSVTYTGGAAAWVGVVQAIEGSLDLATWAAETVLTLRRAIPLTIGTTDALVAPDRPEVPALYSMSNSLSFPWRLGGRTGVPEFSGDWVGVTTNYFVVDPGAPVYPYRARFARPAVPDGARASITVNYAPTWRVGIT